MTTPDESGADELKARRKRKPPQQRQSTPLSETARQEAAEVQANPSPWRRRLPTLFDPREMPVVLEANGAVPPSTLEHYVVAEFDASESVVPQGCVTPVVRSLWARGAHVRSDVYEAHVRARGASD